MTRCSIIDLTRRCPVRAAAAAPIVTQPMNVGRHTSFAIICTHMAAASLSHNEHKSLTNLTDTAPNGISNLPVLYSFRRCPYAIRARMALRTAKFNVVLREVDLGARPAEMLTASPKGSVPVLVLPNDHVIDESLDIMKWALGENDPMHWLNLESEGADELINTNDGEFKHHLDRYKYPEWHAGAVREEHRAAGEVFLSELEQRLNQHAFLDNERMTLVDAAIAPFIRQFAAVDEDWFAASPYPALRNWLAVFLQAATFTKVMSKQPAWSHGDAPIIFP